MSYHDYISAIRSLESAAAKASQSSNTLMMNVAMAFQSQSAQGKQEAELTARLRGLRREENSNRLKRLFPYMREVDLEDMECTQEKCCCGGAHNKLKFRVNGKLYRGCPIDICLAQLRLNLAMDFKIPIDVNKMLELARSKYENQG